MQAQQLAAGFHINPTATDVFLALRPLSFFRTRIRSMDIAAVKRLQDLLQAFESAMVRRENVIRFLVGRFLLMLSMVIGFWIAVRNTL